MNVSSTIRIGIDFGGVIVQHRSALPGEDTGLITVGDESIAHADVFGTIQRLVTLTDGNVWIVSKAGPGMQTATLKWLDSVHFYSRTGMAPEHVRFCLKREEKADICSQLELTHFIDDKIHVMQILRNVVPNLYLFGESDQKQFCPPWATLVSSWTGFMTVVS